MKLYTYTYLMFAGQTEVIMDRTDKIGTGEDLVRVPLAERIRLNNTPLNIGDAQAFLEWQQLPVRVEFSYQHTKRRWGSAWPKERRIVLYRHTVWIFLHDLAHVLCNPGEHHGHRFARCLEGLYLKWK